MPSTLHTFRATEYTRDDGVVLIQRPSEKWVLRCNYGCSWFWDPNKDEWVPITVSRSLDEYEVAFSEGMNLLETIPRKGEIETIPRKDP
jgi:hypothetical protein